MLTSMEPDIFLAVESKLDDSVYDNEFLPATYSASRKDRKRGGGGVFIATKEPIIAEPLPRSIRTVSYAGWRSNLGQQRLSSLESSIDPRTPQLKAYKNGQSAWSDKDTPKPYFSSEVTSTLRVSIGIPSHACKRSPGRRAANSCCRSLQTSTWTSWTMNIRGRTSLS